MGERVSGLRTAGREVRITSRRGRIAHPSGALSPPGEGDYSDRRESDMPPLC